MAASAPSAVKSNPTRAFGRFELRQLLGKSGLSMSWLAFDPRSEQECVLSMPRVQPADRAAQEAWQRAARMSARLDHPHLAPVTEIGLQDHWPYIVIDRALGLTLPEWLLTHPQPSPSEVGALVSQALEGLAFAHEAGVNHRDLQLHHLLVDEQARVRVFALDIGVDLAPSDTAFGLLQPTFDGSERDVSLNTALDPGHLRQRRDAAERDVLSMGLLLHRMLAGQPALDEADNGRVIARLPPLGRETVRLPWATPFPIDEGLRAIANRACDRQPRQRYLNARTLWRALDGWRQADALDNGGPLALLLDRLRTVGHLPALPGVGVLAARLSKLEGKHALEMAEPILRDMALSFELLRQVNTAQVQGTQVAGNGPVLTIRRTLALLGVDGVRQAAAALRAWPGPLNEIGAEALMRLMDRVRLAGRLAQAIRPPGYDPEVIYVIALLQNLGRLLIQYHFPQEAAQIVALMQPAPAVDAEETRDLPGMSEEGASLAVLGVEAQSLGAAVSRHWGLSDEVIHMIRRMPINRPVRNADGDGDLLRMTASAANEAIDALTQGATGAVGSALATIVHRYGRVLGLTQRNLTEALQQVRGARHAPARPATNGDADSMAIPVVAADEDAGPAPSWDGAGGIAGPSA